MPIQRIVRFFSIIIFLSFLFFLSPPQIFAGGNTVSDNFNRADGGLGSNWTTVSGTNAPQIVSNVVEAGTPNSFNMAFWSANTFASDQFVKGSMPNSTGTNYGPGLGVRMGSTQGYFLWYGNNPNTVSIWRIDNASTMTLLANSNTLTVSGNDTWILSAQGSSLTGYQNGTQVVQTTDSTYASGSPGVVLYYGNNQIDNWVGGDTFYSVGGTVSGLSGTVVLQDNNGDNLNVSSSGSFTFNTKLLPNFSYSVTVKTNPTGQNCTVSNGSGTVTSSNITDVSITCSNSTSSLPASDDFNRADGSLGPNWTDNTEGGLSIASQQITTPSGNSGDTRTAESYAADQYSEIQTTASGPASSDWIGVSVRTQNGGQDQYLGIYYNNSGTYQLQLFKRIGGSYTGLSGVYNCGLLPAGTKLRLTVIGDTIVFLENGVERLTAHDTSISSGGSPGIMSFGSGNQADNWTGGNASDFMVNYLSTDANGVESYDVISKTNGPGAQTLRVLRPTNPTAGVRHSFLYLLPVEAGLGTSFGDGMTTLRTLDAQDQYNLTIIEPSFGIEPWYADNPNNSEAQQETFMTQQLVPWVNQNLETTGYEQSWLMGFSKSGIGGMDLLLKHPDLFTFGGFWDWPADINAYNEYDPSSTNSYGTDANFQANYRLTSAFMDAHKTPFLTNNRIWIGSYQSFQTDVADFDTLLTAKGMKHTTETPTSRLHRWDSGWVPDALAALSQDSTSLPDTTAPTVTAFTVPSTANSLTVSVTSFTAKDDSGVTGYKITESSTPPSAGESGWSSTAPTSYTASCGGTKTLYAWAKDAAGNVSTSLSASVTVSGGSCTNASPTSSPTNSSSNSSASSSQQSDPNVISGWSEPIMAGPHFVGTSNYISGNNDASNAQTFIEANALHDDANVGIKSITPADLAAQTIPFPWQQGFNTAGEIFDFTVIAAFNGYPIKNFDRPVSIIIPYDPLKASNIPIKQLAIAMYDPLTKKWLRLSNIVINTQNHTLATTVRQFSYFVVVYPSKNKFSQTTPKIKGASTINKTKAHMLHK